MLAWYVALYAASCGYDPVNTTVDPSETIAAPGVARGQRATKQLSFRLVKYYNLPILCWSQSFENVSLHTKASEVWTPVAGPPDLVATMTSSCRAMVVAESNDLHKLALNDHSTVGIIWWFIVCGKIWRIVVDELVIWWSLMIVVDWGWARPTPINSKLIWCRIPPIAAKKRQLASSRRASLPRREIGCCAPANHASLLQCTLLQWCRIDGHKWSTAIRSQSIHIQPRCKYYVSGRL